MICSFFYYQYQVKVPFLCLFEKVREWGLD